MKLKTLALLTLLLTGCVTNGSKESSAINRLETVPGEAEVYIARLGLGPLYTPCDLSDRIRKSDVVTIHRKGYKVWKKQLSEAWQPNERLYRVVLEKAEE